MNVYKCIAEDCYQEKYNSFSEDCFELVIAETRGKAKSLAHSNSKKMGGLAYYGEFTDWRVMLEAKNINYKEEGIPENDSPIWWIGLNLREIMQMFIEDTLYDAETSLKYLDEHLEILNQLEMITG